MRLSLVSKSSRPFRCPSILTGIVVLLLIVRHDSHAAKARSDRLPVLSISLSTNDPLNLFFLEDISPSKPVTLAIEAKNLTDRAESIRYDWTLTDYWGKTVRADHSTSAPVTAGGTDHWFLSFHRDADLKAKTGIYQFQITASRGRDRATAQTAFGIIPRPVPGLRERSLFGVAVGETGGQTIEALQRIGARWLRTDSGCNWLTTEPKQKGEFNWDRFDRISSETHAHDVNLLPVLDYAPDWAKQKGPDGKPYQDLDAPENVQDHADFVAAAISRYTREIKYWETWNEPIVMGPTWHTSAQKFRDMMKADYTAAKKADPNSVILASGANPSHLQDVVFAPMAEAADSVDVTSVHTYGAGGPEEDFFGKCEHAALISRKNGKDRVWVTEQGWPLGDSPKLAQYIPRAYVLAAIAGISQLDWSTLADDEKGLFTKEFTPRSSAVAYAVAAHHLEDGLFIRDLWPYSRTIYGAVFKNAQGRKTAVVWAIGDHGTMTLENAKGVEAYDLMGASTGRRDGEKLEIPIGEDVIYLSSDEDQSVFLDQVQNAKIIDITPVEIVVKPFLIPISQTPPLRVQITNQLNRPIDGDLEASAPKGWKLAQDKIAFGPIDPGATSVVEIPVRQSTISPDNRYPVSVTAVSHHSGIDSLLARISGPDWRIRRQQVLFLAGVLRGTPIIDADLSDWPDALPIHLDTKAFVSPWSPEKWVKAWTPGNLSAVVYTMYDDNNFYVSAKVTDNVHAGLSVNDNPYIFPFDGDSLQVAFGSPDVPSKTRLKPSTGAGTNRGLLYDTDYEFSFALTPRGPEAVRLRTPDTGPLTWYPSNPDVGLGLISDVKLAVKRDDVNELTTYEAAIPWADLNGIPKGRPFHFAVKINDRDRANGLEGWIESPAGAGEIRGNELSFSPSWQYTTANLNDWVLLGK